MKTTAPLAIALTLCGFLSPARAEEILLSCVVASQDAPKQNLLVKVSDGHVFYGQTMASLVAAGSMNKGSLSVGNGHISFRQTWPASHVQWDWSIDRGSGDISIKYINTANKRVFLTKRGLCTGG
jgi:hypothetical protein